MLLLRTTLHSRATCTVLRERIVLCIMHADMYLTPLHCCVLLVLSMLQDRVTACTRSKKLSQLEALITVIQCILSNPHFQQLHAYLGQVILALQTIHTCSSATQ
jgi:hypothetical protein